MTSKSDEPLTFVVEHDDSGRADHVVRRRFPKTTRRRLTTLFATGAVKVDGVRAKKGTMVSAGATVEVTGAPPSDDDLAPVAESEPLDVLFEDADLLAVNKPAGRASHPLSVGELGTVANLIVAHAPEAASASPDSREGGLVHRLDRNTTGVLLAAKNRQAWERTRDAFRDRRVRKDYLALVTGDISNRFTIDLELETRGSKSRVAPGTGLEAHTSFVVAARTGAYALVHCRATTGRMHQIRAHLAAAGAPIVGDTLYSGDDCAGDLVGHFLHALVLSVPHPVTSEQLTITAPLSGGRDALLVEVGFRPADFDSGRLGQVGSEHQETVA